MILLILYLKTKIQQNQVDCSAFKGLLIQGQILQAEILPLNNPSFLKFLDVAEQDRLNL